MSWIFTPEQAVELSQAKCLDGEPSVPLSRMSTASESLSNDNEMESLNHFLSGITQIHSMESRGRGTHGAFAPGSHANRGVAAEKVVETQMTEISGRPSIEFYGKWDQSSCSWRTLGTLFPMTITVKSSESWTSSGLMLDGKLGLPLVSEETMFEIVCGSLDDDEREIVPTPTATERSGYNYDTGRGYGLSYYAKRITSPKKACRTRLKQQTFPTPRASRRGPTSLDLVIDEGSVKRRGSGQKRGMDLATAVKLWPTPYAGDTRDRGCLGNPAVQRRLYNGKQLNLSMVVDDKSGSLNPAWVEWVMGWPLGWHRIDPFPVEDWDSFVLHMRKGTWWQEEPDIPRVQKGVKLREDKLKCLGNGMVPLCFVASFTESTFYI